MSGIVGSKLNIRGSGRVAKLGTDGQVLTSSGAGVQANYEDAAGGGLDWQSVVTASTFTAVAGNGYPVNTTSNACTVTLPASASVGDEITFTDYARNFATNALTINPNSLNFQGNSSPNPVYDTVGESIHIVYMDATKGWIPTYDGAVAMETPQTTEIEYLVIAGAGGGGTQYTGTNNSAGGGGAGGYRTNYGGSAITLTGGNVYSIVVGTGGAGGVYNGNNRGINGVDSSLSGTGITTITSTGGGGGGSDADAGNGGQDGGSGGGSAQYGTTGSGNTPSTSPAQGYDGGDGDSGGGAGGGGGSSAVGVTASAGSGAGGAGTSNSITGSAVVYAGGGGGGGYGLNTSGAAGGTGGGGAGGDQNASGTNGTDALGGGGGASGSASSSGAYTPGDGGNGVVILRMADADYSGTTTGSPTVATGVSGDTVLTFTAATGSYTA